MVRRRGDETTQVAAMWLLPSMSRLSLRPARRAVVTTGAPVKKQKTGATYTYYEQRFNDFFELLPLEEKEELLAYLAEQYKAFGLDPNGKWLTERLPDALLQFIFKDGWETEPIDSHWKWKYDTLFKANERLMTRRMLRKKGLNVADEESAPSRKRAKQLASQQRWKQSFDIDNKPRGAVLEVDDRVVRDLEKQFPRPEDLRNVDDMQGAGPSCCMHNG